MAVPPRDVLAIAPAEIADGSNSGRFEAASDHCGQDLAPMAGAKRYSRGAPCKFFGLLPTNRASLLIGGALKIRITP
jgi:hypothetical protein